MRLAKVSDLKIERHLAILILLLSSCAVIWVTIPIWQNQNLNDDSFITLTYVKNLVAGRGFVYNHPPATLGTTTPLFVFLTAFLTFCLPFLSVIEIAILLSALSWIGVAWILYLIMRRLNFQPFPAALAASIPLLIMHYWTGFIGMEIWLFQFLFVLSIYLGLKSKNFYAGLCVAALFLTRGEGALTGSVIFGYLWLNQRKMPTAFIGGAVSVVAIWAIYALMTFGTVIPNTLAAKQAQAQLPSGGQTFIDRIVFDLVPNYIRSFTFFNFWFFNPYLILAGLGLAYTIHRCKPLLIFIVWGGIYLAGYALLNPKPYFWYMLHVVFILQVMAGVGLAALLTIMRESHFRSLRMLTGLFTVILALSFLYFGFRFIAWAPNFTGDERALAYKAVSEWLRDHSEAEDSVALIEIGYLGYFTDNRIIDLAGLTDPIITAHMATGGFSWGFWHYQPDYYIYLAEFDWALGDIKPALEQYTLVHQVERNTFPTPIQIFKRNGG